MGLDEINEEGFSRLTEEEETEEQTKQEDTEDIVKSLEDDLDRNLRDR
jgi:hypothetical protein